MAPVFYFAALLPHLLSLLGRDFRHEPHRGVQAFELEVGAEVGHGFVPTGLSGVGFDADFGVDYAWAGLALLLAVINLFAAERVERYRARIAYWV